MKEISRNGGGSVCILRGRLVIMGGIQYGKSIQSSCLLWILIQERLRIDIAVRKLRGLFSGGLPWLEIMHGDRGLVLSLLDDLRGCAFLVWEVRFEGNERSCYEN
jgi:hypothetical protein